jgi:hypothetical protein
VVSAIVGRTCERHGTKARGEEEVQRQASEQGLTLVHFSAHLEPCLIQENTLHTLNTP